MDTNAALKLFLGPWEEDALLPSLSFAVFGKPEPAGSKRIVRNRATGAAYVVDDNPKAAAWKRKVALVAADVRRLTGYPILTGPVGIKLVFHLLRPASVSRPYPTVRPDALKLARGVEDALSGVLYGDDAQIVEERLAKLYGEMEGVNIRIWPKK